MHSVEKKIRPSYFEEILAGKKTFELRLNDFAIAEGDTLLLREWDPRTKDYTGREMTKKVGHIGTWKISDLTEFWTKEEIEKHGLQVISLL